MSFVHHPDKTKQDKQKPEDRERVAQWHDRLSADTTRKDKIRRITMIAPRLASGRYNRHLLNAYIRYRRETR